MRGFADGTSGDGGAAGKRVGHHGPLREVSLRRVESRSTHTHRKKNKSTIRMTHLKTFSLPQSFSAHGKKTLWPILFAAKSYHPHASKKRGCLHARKDRRDERKEME